MGLSMLCSRSVVVIAVCKCLAKAQYVHAYLSKANSHTVFTAAAKYLNAFSWIPDLSNQSTSSSQTATCSKTHCILPLVIRGENRTQHTQAWHQNTQGKTPWRIKKARLIQQDLSTTFRSGCKSAKVSRLFLTLKGRSRFMAVCTFVLEN